MKDVMWILFVLSLGIGTVAVAQESDRGLVAKRRAYAGGVDEDDLRVQEALPPAVRKTDPREMQRQVFKQIYKREAEHLKGTSDESVEE